MRSRSLAIAVGGALLGRASAQTIGVGLPCIVGSPDVCLNANVLSLADANANVVLTCVDGLYTSYLCATGEGCQGGTCVTILAPPTNTNTGTGATVTADADVTTTDTNTGTVAGPTSAPVIGVGVPCIVGVAADVCLNANVLSLADANANVILECVGGFYAAVLCPAGQGCQNGQCITLLGEANTNTATTTDDSSNTATITDNATTAPPSTLAGVPNPASQPSSSQPTGSDDATGRGAPSTSDLGNLPISRYPPPPSAWYDPNASLDPNGRGGRPISYVPYPVTQTVTDYVTVSQCWNGVWETAVFCEVRPICGCEADKPKPTYVYKTKYQPATKCLRAGCAEETDTIIYPYCESCEAQTECVVPTPVGCNTCAASTITVACSTTPNVPVVTSTISNSATITYAPPASSATPVVPVVQTTSKVATPSLPVFVSGASAVTIKGSAVALGAIAIAAMFF